MIIELFIDGSVNPQQRLGFGAYISVSDQGKLSTVYLKMFENTSSTQLEIETFLWAIEDINIETKLTVYTDCQNIIGLFDRRKSLKNQTTIQKQANP